MSLLGEIKRRKVFQVAAVYTVVSWLLVQVITSISEPLSLPDWADTLVIVLLAVGFPIAVILAWAFDLTPQGIRGESDVQETLVPVQAGGQWLNYILQGLVLVAVGFLVIDQYALEPGASVGRSADPLRRHLRHRPMSSAPTLTWE
jgi:fucose permease